MVISTDLRGVTMEQSKETDIGIITPKGIWFEGMIFSCSLAIKERWYQISEHIGGWPVAIRYSAELPNEIYIRLHDGSYTKCSRIDHINLESSTVAEYYIELQRLAALRKASLKSKRLKNREDIHIDE